MSRFEATILTAERGRRLAKLYRDAAQRPSDYDAGALFTAAEINCKTFDAFVKTLAALMPDECLIRGALNPEAREDAKVGVSRRAYDRADCEAAFDAAERNWIVLDFDKTATPFDVADVNGSIEAWRATLPDELRTARSAFFLSASSHLSPTVRGKLLVALAEPVSNEAAAAYARSIGADPSVSHTVQPNYFAAPVFEGCTDPIAGQRKPIVFDGAPVKLVIPTASKAERESLTLGERKSPPVDVPEPTDRAMQLAVAIESRWLDGNRVEDHAWLHLAGWLLNKGWGKGEIGSLLQLIDSNEPDAAKRAEHWHILGNARAIEGPGGAREWLGDDFDAVDKLAAPANPWSDRLAERHAFASVAEIAARTDETDGLIYGSLSDSPPRQTFIIPELEIGVGRPWGWVGKSNATKTLTAQQLEVDLALGRPVFGRFSGPGTVVPVLRIAYEGFAKAAEDYLRLLRGTGVPIDFADLNGRLRFAEGRHFLGTDSDANREWLLRVTAPFGGGVCIIDPLVAACRGLDENSTEIAQPIYDLEGVSKANGVAFIIVHHFGHGALRARGSSAIDGAFGASAAISKVDGNGRHNHRLVECQKRNRYGFREFELVIRDTTATGKPWLPTPEALQRNEVSWAVRVEAAEGVVHVPQVDKRRATIERHADALASIVRDGDAVGAGVTIRAARDAVKVSGDMWSDVLLAAKRLGVKQSSVPGPRGAIVLHWEAPTGSIGGFRRPT